MQASENLVWGVFFQDLPRGAYRFLSNLSFLVRPGQPVSSPRPTRIEEQARAGAVKDGALAPPARGLVLDGSEHDGTLAVVGMTTFEGSPRVVHEHSRHILVFGGSETQTMMQ